MARSSAGGGGGGAAGAAGAVMMRQRAMLLGVVLIMVVGLSVSSRRTAMTIDLADMVTEKPSSSANHHRRSASSWSKHIGADDDDETHSRDKKKKSAGAAASSSSSDEVASGKDDELAMLREEVARLRREQQHQPGGGRSSDEGGAESAPVADAAGDDGAEAASDVSSSSSGGANGRRETPSRHTPLSASPIRTRKNSGAKARAACRYVFDRYEASPWEHKYFENINEYQKHVCETMNSEFYDVAMRYKKELSKCTPNKISDDRKYQRPSECNQPGKPVSFDEGVFSKMHYRLECDESAAGRRFKAEMPATETAYIEPLVGMLRHPMFCYKRHGGHNNLFNKNYMVHDEWTVKRNFPFIDAAERKSPTRPKVFYFDAGGSIWSDGESQAWFHHQYEKWCLDIDGGYFVWETTKHDPRKIMEVVPGHVKPFYHWFNSFTNADPNSWDNPLNQMLRLVEPEDYVVFKLDIDKYEIERPIIDAILENKELYERVDEFYFEHHVTVEPMMAWWGTSASANEFQNSSMTMFTEMRKRGIRSHSWV